MYPIFEPSLIDTQHGFMKHKSCTTQLLDISHMIGRVSNTSDQVDVIYLDFSKTFNSVNQGLKNGVSHIKCILIIQSVKLLR